MASPSIIDTYPAFLSFWEQAHLEPLERQIECWASEYLSPWPELLAKQQADYASQHLDWRQIARERVFPFLSERLPAMTEARENLLKICPPLYHKAQQVLAFEAETTFVIYVGIGCGAGWVTTFQGTPAILFGLENIAECGWSDADSITGLVAHELGHVVHYAWRAQHGLSEGVGAWWQLYSEGFAQRCEQVILGDDNYWHESSNTEDDNWFEWCQNHRGWLASEFLRLVQEGQPVHQFFGSWYDIEGYSQCGYFLGHEVIKELEASASLREIACLDDIEQRFRIILERFAELGAPNPSLKPTTYRAAS